MSKEFGDNPRKIRLITNPEMSDAIDSMMHLGGLSREVELCNVALNLLRWATQMVANGYQIAAYDETRKRFRIVAIPGYFDKVAGRDSQDIGDQIDRIAAEHFLREEPGENSSTP